MRAEKLPNRNLILGALVIVALNLLLTFLPLGVERRPDIFGSLGSLALTVLVAYHVAKGNPTAWRILAFFSVGAFVSGVTAIAYEINLREVQLRTALLLIATGALFGIAWVIREALKHPLGRALPVWSAIAIFIGVSSGLSVARSNAEYRFARERQIQPAPVRQLETTVPLTPFLERVLSETRGHLLASGAAFDKVWMIYEKDNSFGGGRDRCLWFSYSGVAGSGDCEKRLLEPGDYYSPGFSSMSSSGFAFYRGYASGEVASMELRVEDKDPLPIPLYELPPSLGTTNHLYVLLLPGSLDDEFDAEIVAFDANGRLLENQSET